MALVSRINQRKAIRIKKKAIICKTVQDVQVRLAHCSNYHLNLKKLIMASTNSSGVSR